MSGNIQGHFSCALTSVRVTKFNEGKMDKQTEEGKKRSESKGRNTRAYGVFLSPPFSVQLVAGDEKIISLLPFKQSIAMGDRFHSKMLLCSPPALRLFKIRPLSHEIDT